MPTAVCRRFTLLDAMIVVAAFGLGLVLVREPIASYQNQFWFGGKHTYFLVNLCVALMYDIVLTYLLAATASLAVVVLRLRQPRPPLRRVFRQPGMVACTVALFSIPLAFGFLARELGPPLNLGSLQERWLAQRWFWRIYAQKCGMAVVGAWLALAVGSHWRPEPGWIDRAGRAVGVYWIVIAILHSVFDWLELLFNVRRWW